MDRGCWCALDADERFAKNDPRQDKSLVGIPPESERYSHVYFGQVEPVGWYHGPWVSKKAKLFRKEAVQFPLNNIYADDTLRSSWVSLTTRLTVWHRKSQLRDKQIQREKRIPFGNPRPRNHLMKERSIRGFCNDWLTEDPPKNERWECEHRPEWIGGQRPDKSFYCTALVGRWFGSRRSYSDGE